MRNPHVFRCPCSLLPLAAEAARVAEASLLVEEGAGAWP
jgi:hypothetical protein